MRWRATWLVCLGGLFLMLAGCQRLHHQKEWTLQPIQSKYLEVDAPSSDQKIEVQVTASEPVTVYVVQEAQLREFDKKEGAFDTSKALATSKFKKDQKSETLQVTVPAGKKYGVVVSAGISRSDVKVVIDGR